MNNRHRTRSKNKRKRQEFNQDDIDMGRSLSQISISRSNPKKKKTRIALRDHLPNNVVSKVLNGNAHEQDKHNEEDNDELVSINSKERFKPRYLKVSDHIFKQMLSNTIKDGDKLIECLDTQEKLHFIRQMTEVTNHLHYLDLQQHLWQDYYNIGVKEGNVWAPKLSKSFAKQHHTCRTYGFPKHIIEQRQKKITYQLQHTINELQQYLIKLEQYAQEWQPSFDSTSLSNAINECVKQGQQRLRQEFEYKRKMLDLNSNDHHLITTFYQLQPNEEQVCLK